MGNRRGRSRIKMGKTEVRWSRQEVTGACTRVVAIKKGDIWMNLKYCKVRIIKTWWFITKWNWRCTDYQGWFLDICCELLDELRSHLQRGELEKKCVAGQAGGTEREGDGRRKLIKDQLIKYLLRLLLYGKYRYWKLKSRGNTGFLLAQIFWITELSFDNSCCH